MYLEEILKMMTEILLAMMFLGSIPWISIFVSVLFFLIINKINQKLHKTFNTLRTPVNVNFKLKYSSQNFHKTFSQIHGQKIF